MSPKGPPFEVFDILQRHVSALCGTMRLFLKEKIFQKFQVFFQKTVLRFLSLRYGADFRRSRLVIRSFCF